MAVHLGKMGATAALMMTAVAVPAAVALQQDDGPKPAGETWVRTELF
ncbi:hypothetical protein [Kribbella sindirgiensis]|nr:hypothetical protein [Kribbella sindirgiensis]